VELQDQISKIGVSLKDEKAKERMLLIVPEMPVEV